MANPLYPVKHPHEIDGHPTTELANPDGTTTLITVCAECQQMRTILFLDKDRWYCSQCRTQGATRPNLYLVA